MPSSGPRLASGLKIKGPKKPKTKPIAPTIIPPIRIDVPKPFETPPVFFHKKKLTSIAISNETIDGSNVVFCAPSMNEEEAKLTKKKQETKAKTVKIILIAVFILWYYVL